MKIDIGFRTDIGCVRDANEDSYSVLTGARIDSSLDAILVVADGMGGGRAGDVASRIVAQTVPDTTLEILASRSYAESSQQIAVVLSDAIARANTLVWTGQIDDQRLRGMGSTCVAAIVEGGRLTVGNVGDSRAYLQRASKLAQLTNDHSEVWEQVQLGKMTREEARTSRYRNTITRAMGLAAHIQPDVRTIPLESGDTLLLCSDGLTVELRDSSIARILAAAPNAQSACDRLVEEALRHGGTDNITVVALRFGEFKPISTVFTEDAIQPSDEDDATDRDAAWRLSVANIEMQGDDDTDDDGLFQRHRGESGRPSRARRRRAGARIRRALPLVAISILMLIAVAEAVAIYLLKTVRPPSQSTNAISQPLRPSALPTNAPLSYGSARTVTSEPELRPEPLRMGPDGCLIAVSRNGAVLHISPEGVVTTFPGSPIGPATPPSDREQNPRHSWDHRVYMALDASGYRYQTDTERLVIQKFSPTGTRVAASIGKGSLTAPADIAVDATGAIYIIDNHLLKRIPVVPPSHAASPVRRESPSGTE